MTSRSAEMLPGNVGIDGVVRALRHRIPQTRVGRGRDLIIEFRDGLEDAAEAYRSTGMSPEAAERLAVQDFGMDEIDRIAADCRIELGVTATMRAAGVAGVGYALILGCWNLYYALFGSVTRFTNGDSVGNGFTIIGGITVLAALLTVGFLRSGRNTRHRARAITLGFAGFGTVSLALTYILALTSHRTAHGSPTQIVAGDVVQALSSIITLAMACAIVHCIWRSAAPLRRTTR